ncbi:MAG: ribose 5-phosphate isomerase B [Clostridiales bacterium]|jgi:ribose 5-phosphate isomerase B|nr:ribose 5-phosphate isomerase B [Clostridiales bacterium]
MKIVLGGDHAAADFLPVIAKCLTDRGHELLELTAPAAERCDYPKVAEQAAREVASGRCDAGVLICGTGIGVSIAANKVRGIRAATCCDTYMARMAKEHNNANIICVGARVVADPGIALSIVEAWLDAEVQGGRHAERVGMIEEIERREH